jgi:type 1 glutamine amidotransferase
MKHLPVILASTAVAALGATGAFAQGASVANTTAPYTATAPADCCTYRPPGIPGQNVAGMKVYLWSGLKSHGEGQHDYPQLLSDFSKLLTDHGAVVEGGFHPPTEAELSRADVVIVYKGDAGFMTREQHTQLTNYVKRGGGLVQFHDTLCGPDPADLAFFFGAGKRHGETNFTLETTVTYDVPNPNHPILAGLDFKNLKITDEAFYKMTWAPQNTITPLLINKIADTPAAQRGGGVGQLVPQMWTYEHTIAGGQPARAFVWMQGHVYDNFKNPTIEKALLRGIAWAGKKPVAELAEYSPPPAGRGGAGGRGGAAGRGAAAPAQ